MDKTWMTVAETISTKSKDPRTKVGAVIVDELNRIVGSGYNGMVAGVSEEFMWGDRKQNCVIHAEMNALLFAQRTDLRGCVMYCTHEMCDNCLKHALQKGIRTFYYKHRYERFSDAQKEALSELKWASECVIEEINDAT